MGATTRVVVSARKGGAGKTVVSVLLARELAKQGFRVLAVDLDPQSVSASLFFGVDTSSPLPYTAVDLVKGANGRPFEPRPVTEGLEVIPGNQLDLARLERILGQMHEQRKLTMGPNPRRGMLDTRLEAVEANYNFVVIDTPTAFGEVTTNALEAASVVISPIDMKNAANVKSVDDLEAHMAGLSRQIPVWYVGNKWTKQESECREALVRASQVCGSRLLSALMPHSSAVSQAMSQGRPLNSSRHGLGAAQLAEAVWKLGQEVISISQQTQPAAVEGGGTQ
ncbi:MAG TPA: ParA family protein [Anaeromyxobacteraceae bacterium]|nr:ParA family protein [Anaeromyxobacteraceae bacterium]